MLTIYVAINCMSIRSMAKTPAGFQVTTCTGCCSGINGCIVTTPQVCSSVHNGNFQNFFTNCSTATCPTSNVITITKGCTYYNPTNDTYTTWFGYTSIANVDIILPAGTFNVAENKLYNAQAGQFPITTFKPGTFLNQFSVVGYQPVKWNVTYDGFTSVVQGDLYTSCVHYCCNSTFCITTNETCNQVGIESGTVISGSYFDNPGVGSNCTNGEAVEDNPAFPCDCTRSVNNDGPCGVPRNITLFFGCQISNVGGVGLCTIPVGYHNPNNENYTIPIGIYNNVSPNLINGSITTLFQTGNHSNAEYITWPCPGGLGQLSRSLFIPQVFANH
jgi:hypothetical protein